MTPAISVVLPVYDEAAVLERTFAELIPHLEGGGRPFEVVCVDDGSRDGSLSILQGIAERDDRVRVVSLGSNCGKGAAVRRGVLLAEGASVFFMDADLSTPLDEMEGFLGALDAGYDVVIGNRRAPGSQITRHQPWIRETLGKVFNTLTRSLLASGVYDFTCGFKAFRRDAGGAIFERATLDGWAFDVELVVIAQQQGLKLAQLPVAWHDEDGTKVRVLSAALASLRDLWVIAAKRRAGAYG